MYIDAMERRRRLPPLKSATTRCLCYLDDRVWDDVFRFICRLKSGLEKGQLLVQQSNGTDHMQNHGYALSSWHGTETYSFRI